MANAIAITSPGSTESGKSVKNSAPSAAETPLVTSLEAKRDEAISAGVLRATLEGDKGQFLRVDF